MTSGLKNKDLNLKILNQVWLQQPSLKWCGAGFSTAGVQRALGTPRGHTHEAFENVHVNIREKLYKQMKKSYNIESK